MKKKDKMKRMLSCLGTLLFLVLSSCISFSSLLPPHHTQKTDSLPAGMDALQTLLQEGKIPSSSVLSTNDFYRSHQDMLQFPTTGDCVSFCFQTDIAHRENLHNNEKTTLLQLKFSPPSPTSPINTKPKKIFMLLNIDIHKINLSEVTRALVNTFSKLDSRDSVGFLVPITQNSWFKKMYRVDQFYELTEDLKQLQNIQVSSLEKSFEELRLWDEFKNTFFSNQVDFRFWIFSSDSLQPESKEKEKLLRSTRKIAEQGIHIATFSLGKSANEELLRTIAFQGGGTFLQVQDSNFSTLLEKELTTWTEPKVLRLQIQLAMKEGYEWVSELGVYYSTQEREGKKIFYIPALFSRMNSKASGSQTSEPSLVFPIWIQITEKSSIVTGVNSQEIAQVSLQYWNVSSEKQVDLSYLLEFKTPFSKLYGEYFSSPSAENQFIAWNTLLGLRRSLEQYEKEQSLESTLAITTPLLENLNRWNGIKAFSSIEKTKDLIQLLQQNLRSYSP